MLQPVAPQDLSDIWPWVREGVQDVILKCNERFLPEDVYHSLRLGHSFLYTIDDVGFVIVKRDTDVSGEGALFVWIMWAEPETMRPREEQCFAELAELARKANCRVVRMHSPREGWERRGWNITHRIYEREV